MPVDEREDHRVERAVGFLKERGGLLGLERAPARDVRDLGEEPRAKEQERLGRLAQRQRPALRLDAVLAAERSCSAMSERTRLRNSAAMRSGGSPIAVSDWRAG